MANCVNINNPEVAKVAESTSLSKRTVAAIFGLWQEENDNYNRFPDNYETLKFLSADLVRKDIEASNVKPAERKDIKDVKKILPKIPVTLRKGLLRMPGSGMTEGQFMNNVITISESARGGVAYHEAFHAVEKAYLTPDQRGILYAEVRDVLGNINEKGEIKSDLEISEDIAENFRYYMEVEGAVDLPKPLKFFYDLLLDFINLFRNNKDTLFSQIRAGRFDYKPSSAKAYAMFERSGLPSDFIDESVKTISYLMFSYSGVRDYDSDIQLNADANLKQNVYNHLVRTAKKARAEGCSDEIFNNFNMMLTPDNFLKLLDMAIDELKAYNYVVDERALSDDSVNKEDDATGKLEIEDSVTRNVKDSATNNTKQMVYLLKDVEWENGVTVSSSSNRFGRYFPKMVNPNQAWSTIELSLRDIVDLGTGDKSFEKLALNKLKAMSEQHAYLNELVDMLENKDFPDYKKTQFYRTFYKTSVDYIMSNNLERKLKVKGKNKYTKDSRIGSAENQTRSKILINRWSDAFAFDTVNGVIDNEGLAQTVKAFKNRMALLNKAKKEKGAKIDLDNYISFLNKMVDYLGVNLDESTMERALSKSSGTNSLQKISHLYNKFKYAIIKNPGNYTLEDVIEGKENDKSFIEDSSVFKFLASIDSETKNLPGSRAVFGPDGKTYFTTSQNNFMYKHMKRLLRDKDYFDKIYKSTYHKHSVFLSEIKRIRDKVENNELLKSYTEEERENIIQDHLKDLGISVMLTYKHEDDVKTPDDAEIIDDSVERINRLLQGVTGQTSYYTPITMGDKKVQYLIKGFGVRKFGITAPDKLNINSKVLLSTFYNYTLGEIERIGLAIADRGTDVDMIKGYNDGEGNNAFKCNIFPALSEGGSFDKAYNLYGKDGSLNLTEDNVNRINQMIVKELRERIKDQMRDFMGTGIIGKDTQFPVIGENNKPVNIGTAGKPIFDYKNNIFGVSESIKAEYGLDVKSLADLDKNSIDFRIFNLVSDYTLNSMIGNVETGMLFHGDPGFYSDLSKRVQEISATGEDLLYKEGIPEKFKLAVARDIDRPSEHLAMYEKLFGKGSPKIKPYREMTKGDAIGYCTPERFRNTMKMAGKWQDSFDSIFDILNKKNTEELTSQERSKAQEAFLNDSMPFMNGYKGMYYSLVERDGKMVPVYVKYSIFPLWRGLTKDTNLDAVLDSMELNETDELVFESGVKAGAMNRTDVSGAFEKGDAVELNNIELDNFFYKIQMETPSKYYKKEEANRGSQVPKNIGVNAVLKELSYKGNKDMEVIDALHEVESKLSDLALEKFKNKYGIVNNKITDKKRLFKTLLDKAISERRSNNIIELLQLGADGHEVPFDAIYQMTEKIESELHSLVTKSSAKLKAKGGAFIQTPSLGFTTSKKLSEVVVEDRNQIIRLVDGEGLKPMTIDADGNTVPGQIYIPFKSVEGIRRNYEVENKKKDKTVKKDTAYLTIGDSLFLSNTENKNIFSIDETIPDEYFEQHVNEVFEKFWSFNKDIVIDSSLFSKQLKESSPDKYNIIQKVLSKFRSSSDINRRIANGEITGKELKRLLGDTFEGVVGYRIPNQGMSSIDVFDIAGILPPNMGDTIITYDDITAKTGSDFDIDKMYVMTYHTQWNAEKGVMEKVPSAYGEDGEIKEYESEEDLRKGLENARLEIWKTIMLAKDSQIDVLSPLDSEWLKEDCYHIELLSEINKNGFTEEMVDILDSKSKEAFLQRPKPEQKKLAVKYFKNKALKPFEFVTPKYQLEVKDRNKGGKIGIGQLANPLTFHAIAQYVGLEYLVDIGSAYSGVKSTDLSQVFIKDSDIKINDVLNAIMNAHLDNAKDPYISLANHNRLTENVSTLLIRSGVKPEIVNRFLAQPSIKEYIKHKLFKESNVLPLEFGTYSTIKVTDEGLKIITVNNAPIDPYASTQRSLFEGVMETKDKLATDIIAIKDLTEDQLDNQILNFGSTEESARVQMKLLRSFMYYEKAGREVSAVVRAFKADTQGSYGSSSANLVARELEQSELLDKFNGVDEIRKHTYLGTMHRNGAEFSNTIFKREFINKTDAFENVTNTIFKQIGRSTINDSDKVNTISRSFKNYVYSGYELFQLNSSDIDRMMKGSKSVAKKLVLAKQAIPNHPFLELLSSFRHETGLEFLKMPTGAVKSNVEADRLWMSWEKLLDRSTEGEGNVELYEGYTMYDFAKELLQYSFITSGFNTGVNTFFEFMPNTAMRGVYGKDTDTADLLEYTSNAISNLNMYPKGWGGFIDQFYRHNAKNADFVPQFRPQNLKRSNVDKNKGFSIKKSDMSDKMIYTDNLGDGNVKLMRPYIYVKGEGLYKYEGSTESGEDSIRHYQAVSELGLFDKGNKLVEYAINTFPSSVANERKPGLSFSALAKLHSESSNIELSPMQATRIDNEDVYVIKELNGYFKVQTKNGKYNVVIYNENNIPRSILKTEELASSKEEALNLAYNKLDKLGVTTVNNVLSNIC